MVLSNFICDPGKATPSPTPSRPPPTQLRPSMPDTTNPHTLPLTPTATLPTRRLFMPTMLPPTPPLLKLETPMPSEPETLEHHMLFPQPESPTPTTMPTMLPLTLPALFATLWLERPLLLLPRSPLDTHQEDMPKPTPRNSSLIQLLSTASAHQHYRYHPTTAHCSDYHIQCGCSGTETRPRICCPASQDQRTYHCRFHHRIKLCLQEQ